MDTDALIKLASQGGLSLVVLGAFLWLIRTVGLALVEAVKEQGKKLDSHTLDENEHHTLVREELANMRGHLNIPTPVHGVPILPTNSVKDGVK